MAAFNQAEEDIEKDCILVQTDCTFNIALAILKSLSNDEIQVCSYKVVTIDNIESNDPDDHYSLRFGGGGGLHLQCFTRTTSSVLRMMMLESVNASRWCPRIGRHSERRNRQKMQLQTFVQPRHGEFVIAATKSAAEEYYTNYDHLHPHSKIENGFRSVQPADWSMQNMMLIFRRDFTEVIEIGTSLGVGHRPNAWTGPGTFHSNAHVRCIVRSISNPNHDGLRFLRALKDTSGYQEECFTLAGLLGQIAQRLPSRQEEEDDHSDASEEEDAQMLLVPPQMQVNHQPHVALVPQQMFGNHGNHHIAPAPQMQGNHQPHVVPALLQRMPPPVQVHVNHQLHAAPASHVQQMPKMQVNHQPHAALVPQQMPLPPQVQKPHVAPVPQQMPPPLQVQGSNHQPHAASVTHVQQMPQVQVNHDHQLHHDVAPVPQRMPPPPQMQGNHQPRAAPAPQRMPPQVQVNHQPHFAPVPQQMTPPPQVQEPHVVPAPQQMPPPPQVQEPHAALVRQQMPPPPQVQEPMLLWCDNK